MRRRMALLATMGFAGLFLTVAAPSQAQESLVAVPKYLNAAYAASVNPAVPDQQKAIELSDIACRVFQEMLADKQLMEQLRGATKYPDRTAAALHALQTDVEALSALLQFETSQLAAAGVQPEAVAVVLQSISLVARLSAVRPVTFDEIVDAIVSARDRTCALRKSAKSAAAKARMTAWIYQLELLIGGGAIITVDAFAIPTSSGLSVVSIAFGGTLLGLGTQVLTVP